MPIPGVLRFANSQKQNVITRVWSTLIKKYLMIRVGKSYEHIRDYLVGKTVLDVGLGPGVLANLLIEKGYKVNGLDVTNISIYDQIRPKIYDGLNMPYKNKEFDIAILIHVLHYCSDPIRVLEETVRCAKRTIIIEDTYNNDFEKMVISINDTLSNAEFYQHPYKKLVEWEKVVKEHKWKLIDSKQWPVLFSPTIIPTKYCRLVVE